MTRLEAKPTQAGKQRRCPVCYHKLRVPTAEEVAAVAAKWKEPGYNTLSGEGAIPSAAAYQTYLSVVCGVCGTRMYASPSQMGQEIRCPDCDAPTRVAPPAQPVPAPQAAPAQPPEEYPVCQGAGQPTRDHVEVYQRYIPVVCPICQTRMLATVDQVGQRLICPDCETPSLVPPLEEVSHEPLPPPRRWDPSDVYDNQLDPDAAPTPGMPAPVAPAPTTPPRPPASTPQLIVATCPVCHTRQDVTPDQLGKALECPDCGTRFPVARPKAAAPPPPDPLDAIGEEYGLAPAPEVAPRKPAVFDDEIPLEFEQHGSPSLAGRAGEERRSAEDLRELDEEWKNLNQQLRDGGGWQPTPGAVVAGRGPRKPAKQERVSFVGGVVNFPFYRGCLIHWLAMTLGLMFVVVPPVFAYAWAIQQQNPEWTWVIVAGILAGFAGLLWSLMSSSTCLAILQDTAEGCDDIENWPEGQLTEWLYDTIYIATALILSVALGAGLLRLLELAGVAWWPRGLAVAIGVGFLAFPFLLMSMLEAGSPLIPFSVPITRSLGTVWWAWFLFYFEATLLVAVTAGLGAAVVIPTHYWGTPAALVLVPAMLMIYFRLLGRLVWCCSHHGSSGEARPLRDDDDLVQQRPSDD